MPLALRSPLLPCDSGYPKKCPLAIFVPKSYLIMNYSHQMTKSIKADIKDGAFKKVRIYAIKYIREL